MIKEFKIPSPGESITEVHLAQWLVDDGSLVHKNDELAEVESDKATLMLVAEEDGRIQIRITAGQTVPVGTVAYTLDTDAREQKATTPNLQSHTIPPPDEKEPPLQIDPTKNPDHPSAESQPGIKATPVALEMMKEHHLSVEDIVSGLRKITKKDVEQVLAYMPNESDKTGSFSREETRIPLSILRRRLSERLVQAKKETAMLTTFNEVDMHAVQLLRSQMQQNFSERYGIKLGLMGFFAKAVSIAAVSFPVVNSRLEGDEIVEARFVDIGIAVQTPKGLMVPVIRNAESKSIPVLETEIQVLARKAREKKISIEELLGGTISITNGGVFGLMLSTPLLNPPQSAILGMHNIVDRPVAIDGAVVIRPMMYLALSYDHRLIDGKDSVGFLKRVKDLIEHPEKMAFDGNDPLRLLLGV